MRRVMTARLGGRYIIVPKLLGLLLVLVSLMFFLASTIDLVTAWDKISDIKMCLTAANDTTELMLCYLKALSVGVYPFSEGISYMDKWMVMFNKAAIWVFWVFVLVIALVIYRSGKLLEVEEEIATATEPVTKESKKKEKETEQKESKRRARRSKTKK